MAEVREGVVWLTVDEAITIIEMLSREEFVRSLDGRHRQRLKAAIKELEDQIRATEESSVQLDIVHLNTVLKLLRLTQDWFCDLLSWLDGVG